MITDENGQEFKTSNFIHGQEIIINFINVEGFVVESNKYFPGLKLMVVSSSNDTVMNYDDIYPEYKGFENSIQKLMATITLANLIKFGENYTAYLFL